MTRRDALIAVIESLHAEIAALQANDIAALEVATAEKLAGIERVAANDDGLPPTDELRQLAVEAHRLNETARIYVNLMSANVRRRLEILGGSGLPAGRPGVAAAYARVA